MDLFSFNGQVAVITGGGSGIGKLMAETLAEAGANIAVLGRNIEKVEHTAKDISDKYKVETKGY